MASSDRYRPINQWLLRPSTHPVAIYQGRYIDVQTLRKQVVVVYQELLKQEQTHVILFLQEAYLFTVALLATLHAGKTPVMLGHHRVAQLIQQDLQDTLILTDSVLPTVENYLFINPLVESVNLNLSMIEQCVLPSIADDNRLILYTSGSSGHPKRIEKCISAMDNEVRWLSNLWGDDFSANYVRGSVSHQHMYGLTFRIWLPLSLGYATDSTMVEFPEQLNAEQPYIFITSPAFLQFLDNQLPPPSWTFIVSAGGALSWTIAQSTIDWSGIAVHEIYGSTETGVVAHRVRQTQQTLWSPFSELKLEPINQQQYRLHSPLLAPAEYFLLEDKLAITEQGTFSIIGRVDKVVKIGEKRLSLTEVEQQLLMLEEIIDVTVIPVKHRQRTYLGAVLVLADTTTPHSPQQITRWRKHLRQLIDPVAIPRFWRVVPIIPVDHQSKRSWETLQELFNVTD